MMLQVSMQVKGLHKTNIMSAKFLPQSGDRHAVSCSGDGVIMVSGKNKISEYECIRNYTSLFTLLDLEKEDGTLQDMFKCHQGPVYEVVTVESEPNTFLSVGEDGTARWFDLRATRNCQVSRCKEVCMQNHLFCLLNFIEVSLFRTYYSSVNLHCLQQPLTPSFLMSL